MRENWSTEVFGDYTPETMLITLDFQKFGFRDSWHTQGFYERAAALYHHARGTPPKRLFWVAVPGGRGRIAGRVRIAVQWLQSWHLLVL